MCNLLIDVDEWGQVVIINMLTRYARTQFLNPGPACEISKENKQTEKEEKKSDNEGEEKEEEEEDYDAKFNMYDEDDPKRVMDPDHRLLLRVTKPLLQSRNSAVNNFLK